MPEREPLRDLARELPLRPAPPAAPAGREASLLERFGGSEAVARVVDAFYGRIERDPELRPLFPEDPGPGREKQKLFLDQWLGGEPRYSEQHGPPMLRRRHFPFVISQRAAERWLGHMRAAIEACGVPAEAAAEVMAGLAPLARHMVNEGDDVSRTPLEW